MPAVSDRLIDSRLSGRILVISPHLDDAILSLGATIARAVDNGARVDVLTVFACNTQSSAPADDWDRRAGFGTEGDAARRRREEDRAACAILGATPRWLDYGAQPYDRGAGLEEIVSVITPSAAAVGTVLIPGFPLAHSDHAALSRGLLRSGVHARNVGLYAEQPYTFDRRLGLDGPLVFGTDSRGPAGSQMAAPPGTGNPQALPDSLPWERSPASREQRRRKFEAVKQYRSQLRLLGLRQTGRGHLRLRMMLWNEARQGGEAIAWLKTT